MNFSLSIERKKDVIRGDAIQTHRIMPDHAQHLRVWKNAIRHANDANRKAMRMYEAAVTNNLNQDFPVSITSANAEIFNSIIQSKSRARRLERDNPYVHAIIETFQNNVVGCDPFRLEMKVGKSDAKGKFTPETDTNRKIEAAWRRAGQPENCTVSRNMSRLEVDLMAISALIRDGGILFKQYAGFSKNPFGFAIEPIEIDRLDPFYNRSAAGDQNKIQFSIEMDKFNGPEAYWILTRHPGDIVAPPIAKDYRERIPAQEVLALWDIRTRGGQLISMPRFASIIQRLHRIDQFDIAHCTAAIVASAKPLFLTRKYPTGMEVVPDHIKTQMEGEGNAEDNGERFNNVQPGEAEELPMGLEPMLIDPKFPIEAASDFKKDNLRAAAAGSGAPYSTIANDLEAVNFSSGRLGMEAFRDTCKILQQIFIENFRRPHFNNWLPMAIVSGEVDLPMSRVKEFQEAAIFHGRRWPYVNPLQDIQADILKLEAGLTSRDYIIQNSDRGGDVETVNAEIAAGRDNDEMHDLDFVHDPDLAAESFEEAPPPTAAKKKPANGRSKRVSQVKKLEKTLRVLAETDPSDENTENLKEFLEFRSKRNGNLVP